MSQASCAFRARLRTSRPFREEATRRARAEAMALTSVKTSLMERVEKRCRGEVMSCCHCRGGQYAPAVWSLPSTEDRDYCCRGFQGTLPWKPQLWSAPVPHVRDETPQPP
eukprot:scaffold27940_cov32-Tisochrysis_lutea.AAC.3